MPRWLCRLRIVEMTLDHEAPYFSNMRRRNSRKASAARAGAWGRVARQSHVCLRVQGKHATDACLVVPHYCQGAGFSTAGQ